MNDSICGLVPAGARRPASALEMREIEDRAVSIGVSRILMMENAGANLARFAIAKLDEKKAQAQASKPTHIVLVAGTGNNGGDVFVAARHLMFWLEKSQVSVLLIGAEEQIVAQEASANWKILKQIGADIIQIRGDKELPLLEEKIRGSDVIVVGIFGTGFKGRPRELQARVIELINSDSAREGTKISVDVPSGMEADTGAFEVVVKSDFTITMGAPKKGLASSERAKEASGEVLVANIGVPV